MSITLFTKTAGRMLAGSAICLSAFQAEAQTKITLEQAIDSAVVHNI